MDYIWTPWRYQYMAEVARGGQPECIFCEAVARNNDAETLIVHRGAKAFIILNRFPYTSGHVMIVPYAHVAELNLCDAETLSEMMQLAQAGGKGLARKLQTGWDEPGNESGTGRGGRCGRPFAFARAAALDRGFEFHDGDRGDARASGRTEGYVRATDPKALTD